MANHLIIGLGGTGGNILRGLRKRIYAETGQKDVKGKTNIDYLYVDSSEKDLDNKVDWTYMGEPLHLAPSQKINIHGMGAGVLQNTSFYPGIAAFLSEDDRKLLQNDQVQSIISTGIGGQRRRFGRMLMANNIALNKDNSSFDSRVKEKVNSLISGGEASLQFHICAGLAGGTGSGSIVDAVCQVRKATQNMDAKVFLYLYVPEVLVENPNHDSGYYHANGYAALAELNAMALDLYHPVDVSGEVDYTTQKVRTLLHGCEAFDKAYLFSNINETGQMLPNGSTLPEAVADFIFQKTIAESLVPGQDAKLARLASSENDGCAPEKNEELSNVHSRDFMTFGIKRIEYPETEIKEYVAYNFAVQAARQLQYNDWVDGKGYDTISIDEIGLGYKTEFAQETNLEALKLSDTYLTLQTPIKEIKGVTDSWQAFEPYWDTITIFHADDAKCEPDKKSWLAFFVDRCEEEYCNLFRGVGVKKFFESQASENKGYAAYIRRHIESLLFAQWKSGEKSLLEVEKYLQVLIDRCSANIGKYDDMIAKTRKWMEDETQVKIAEIEIEWSNIGWLKDAVTGASKKVLDRFCLAKREYYICLTEIAAYGNAKLLLQEIISQLSSLLKSVSGEDGFKPLLLQVLKGVSESAEQKCKVQRADAPSGRVEVLDKRYNPEQIRELTSSFTRDRDLQVKNARDVREYLTGGLSEDELTFGVLAGSNIDRMSSDFIRVCKTNAENALTSLAEKDDSLKILGVNVLERIQRECNTDELLEDYVKGIVRQAHPFIQFDDAEIGKAVQGASHGKKSFIQLCLPEYHDRTNFRDRFIEMFRQQCPGFNPAEDVSVNFKSSQIVVICASSNYPLRYIKNMKFLQDKYNALVGGPDGALNKVLLYTESGLSLPSVFGENEQDKASRLRPYAILLHSIPGIVETGEDPVSGAPVSVVKCGEGFSAEYVKVGRNMEATLSMMLSDGASAKKLTALVDTTLAASYQRNDAREQLRKVIENKVVDEILPLAGRNTLNPLFVAYKDAAVALFNDKLANR